MAEAFLLSAKHCFITKSYHSADCILVMNRQNITGNIITGNTNI